MPFEKTINPFGETKEAPKASKQPIVETQTSVTFMGVSLPKAENARSPLVPDRRKYEENVHDKEVSLPLMRDLATAWHAGEPIIVEGGSSLGKTTTVLEMASLLGWEVYRIPMSGDIKVLDLMGKVMPNTKKKKPEDPDYAFVDGQVTRALRQEPGRIKVLLIDEINTAPTEVLFRLHSVLDSLERNSDEILTEDASETVGTNKQRTKVVFLMNPPGQGFKGREELDQALMKRCVYKKMPNDLPKATFLAYGNAVVGLGPKRPNEVPPEMLHISQATQLLVEQLPEVPGFAEVWPKYLEFHLAAKAMFESEEGIAQDQPQRFKLDDHRELRRVRDFICRFYSGDLNYTIQQALRYFYANKLESTEDRERLNEQIKLVAHKPGVKASKRIGLEAAKEETKGGEEGPEDYEKRFTARLGRLENRKKLILSSDLSSKAA